MKSIAIFCGSALGTDTIFAQTARLTGETLAKQGKTLVYGGGRSGLMGIVADSALEAGGQVIGVIPQGLVDRELAHPDLTELHIVKNMHERKTIMSELSDGFIALPGGAGTIEEIFEQWTWAQLGIHLKPCAFLNIEGFYDDLIKFIQLTTQKGFSKARFTDVLMNLDSIDEILSRFEVYQAPEPKWGVKDPEDLVKLDR
ncbi:TIGR00730 family Rossman fold protein [Acinetobacter silvestris]|uniref:Cytokinin riboside 5'-monophosphate phosphoribohydrolase n=1 Tax=Acinetobacter silvestris TaxID=1977882 RepID=A0A1Y3CLW9_9GAMM|nr:TIGR00730 family Rossman fold protein [Acinetobacter silvestris]OTG67488.1 Rossman fold protein, TIGR00730 family [Acinetobacter silvestris]